jgi:quinol monooxygenase YgiN|uniref:putative quinol monooxygenase n=1 Tax=Prevotella sp. TaxID=59823 RepID=UPI004024CCD7
MIRLNVFFEKKESVKAEELNALCEELVEKSLKDNGNVAYDYFVSGTRNGVMMICETWQNEEVLKAHMATDHFTTLVPKIEALTKSGLKLEQFAF